MADADLYNLEFLSLVAKITQEIDNHTGLNDKTLAEFVIDLHDQSKTLPEFKQKLKEAGANFPDSFIENVDRLILQLHPKHKKKPASGDKENAGIADGGLDETDKKRRLFPGLALKDQEWEPSATKDAVMKEVDDLMSQFEGAAKRARGRPAEGERSPKRRRTSTSRSPPPPPRRQSPSPPRGRGYGDHRDGGYGRHGRGRPLDDRPVLFKIYDGRVSGLKDFGAFVQLEGVAGRVEGTSLCQLVQCALIMELSGMVHVSNIQQGARANSASDLLSRGQNVKVKVMSVAGNRVGLSMKDVDQTTGRDLTPHLRIKSEAELAEEERLRSANGANAIPLKGRGPAKDEPVRSAKRLTSPERWEIKQLISSGVIDASEYPDLAEDLNDPMARAEVEEDMDVEIREEEPPFLAGQTKKTLDLSPVKIVKAPDGSLNRAALAGASLAKERRELRQQEVNEQADSEARDFSAPWLDPMAKESDRVFAQDLRGNLRGQKAGEQPKWKEATFNKATTYGEITSLSIQEQRKSLPIYKLRDALLQAVRDVSSYPSSIIYTVVDVPRSTKC